MKYNKLKAFTLAEIMVLLLTLAILMAAFAPVFTRRFNNVTSDEVWTYIPGDDNYNAYFDAPNKLFVNQAFIGLTPISADEVNAFSAAPTVITTGSGYWANSVTMDRPAYSKLVVAASKRLGGITGAPPQNQMQFRVATSSTDAAGALVGSLFAGDKNLLLGGPYSDITTAALANTAYGPGALKSLKDGDGNTAVGNNALSSVTSGNANTAVGFSAGAGLKSGLGNTFVGAYSGSEVGSAVNYNTAVGIRAGDKITGSGNTVVGNYALAAEAKDGNTAVGNYALQNSTGKYNTAVGYKALSYIKKGNYNTAIGSSSCMLTGTSDIDAHEISKVTCIGAGSGFKDQSATDGDRGLPTGDNVPDRVFIGKFPDNSTLTSNAQKPFAVLEVHNSINGPQSGLTPIPGGEESVIVNGNLVVRGMTYLEAAVYRPPQGAGLSNGTPKALMLYRTPKKHADNFYVFAGFDGIDREGSSKAHCRRCSHITYNDIRPSCICTAVGPSLTTGNIYSSNGGTRYSSTSYDWYSKSTNSSGIHDPGNGMNASCDGSEFSNSYTDQSTGGTVSIYRQIEGGNFGSRGTESPYSHIKGSRTCCPDLRASDVRLKNVGEAFTAGLDEIKKINVYKYTYKDDARKLPQVGVVAQDLKTVFPKAVFKDKRGYYMIRWDEMFYAAINAVKALNAKINNLASKIATDKDRITALKRDNAAMNLELDRLVEELEVLEAKKK